VVNDVKCEQVLTGSVVDQSVLHSMLKYERLPATLAGLHLVVFACLMLHQWMAFAGP